LERVGSAPQGDNGLAAQIHLALGEAYSHLGYADRQAQAYRQALDLDTTSPVARMSLGDALLKAGNVDEAIDLYRRALRSPDAPVRARVQLVRALMQRNVYLPPKRRDWKEIDPLLEELAKNPAAAVMAALLQAEANAARGQPGEARKVLERAARAHPGDADLTLALADLAAGRGEFDEAVRRLNDTQGKAGRTLEERVARLDAWAQHGSREAARSLEEAAHEFEHLAEADQVALLCHLVALYLQADKQGEWLRLCRKLVDKPLHDLAAAQQLLEAVMPAGDPELMTTVVNRLRALEGEGGTAWRYGAAAVLVAYARAGQPKALAPARGWLDIVISVRPGWPKPALLLGQIEEMEGHTDRAVDHYLKAFDLGDRQPGAVYRLVQLLAQRGRDGDADRVVRQYRQQTALGRDFARQAAEIALQAGNFDHALELAGEVVPADDANFRDHLWLARLLTGMAKRQEAERALYRATELAPRVPDTWVALVSHLVQAGQSARAREVIAALANKLAPDQVQLARARCWLALYRTDRAEEEYRAALAARPGDGRVLLAAAGFYVRLGEAAKAEPLLRKLLGPGVLVAEEDRPALRRQLALALSESGDEAKRQEALALLDRDPPAEAIAYRRTRLLVVAARPDQRKEALAMLDGVTGGPPLAPEERYRLAGLYDAENDWTRARTLMLDLLGADGYNPAYLTFFIQGLLLHNEQTEAGPWLTRLEKAAPDAPRTIELRAKVRAPAG
jgi:tetratricopeptide (TPR) repeat protein